MRVKTMPKNDPKTVWIFYYGSLATDVLVSQLTDHISALIQERVFCDRDITPSRKLIECQHETVPHFLEALPQAASGVDWEATWAYIKAVPSDANHSLTTSVADPSAIFKYYSGLDQSLTNTWTRTDKLTLNTLQLEVLPGHCPTDIESTLI